MNSLTAIATEQAQDGEEEEWEREMRGWNGEEEVRSKAVQIILRVLGFVPFASIKY